MKRFIIFFILVVGIAGFLSVNAFAQTSTTIIDEGSNIVCGQNGVSLPGCQHAEIKTQGASNFFLYKLLPKGTSSLVPIAGIIGVVMLGISSLKFTTAMGTLDKAKKAVHMILHVFMGLGIAMLAYVAVQIILNLQFGI